ncbi:MAG: radical SAM protein [Clostridia bacterium]|nr:radical SAM protein [Clostridia bacterium]
MFTCSQCPRKCAAVRAESGAGFCGMGELPVVARMAPHFDEEPCISGKEGSGTVFFSGCSLKCVYCQNAPISHDSFGKTLTVEELKSGITRLARQGVNNINLVNPTHFAHLLPEILDGSCGVPIVYNSSGYELVDTLKKLEGKIDVYLPDLKYVDSALSKRYSAAEDYFDVTSKALSEMLRQVGPVKLDDRGMIKSGLIVRHLVLPCNVRDSIRVVDWIKQNLPGAWISLMAQYMPCAKARDYPEINRPLSPAEYERVCDHMISIGLEDGYVQQMDSSDEKYIPAFDLTGVP